MRVVPSLMSLARPALHFVFLWCRRRFVIFRLNNKPGLHQTRRFRLAQLYLLSGTKTFFDWSVNVLLFLNVPPGHSLCAVGARQQNTSAICDTNFDQLASRLERLELPGLGN